MNITINSSHPYFLCGSDDDTQRCKANVDDERVCSGRGSCKCGECICYEVGTRVKQGWRDGFGVSSRGSFPPPPLCPTAPTSTSSSLYTRVFGIGNTEDEGTGVGTLVRQRQIDLANLELFFSYLSTFVPIYPIFPLSTHCRSYLHTFRSYLPLLPSTYIPIILFSNPLFLAMIMTGIMDANSRRC